MKIETTYQYYQATLPHNFRFETLANVSQNCHSHFSPDIYTLDIFVYLIITPVTITEFSKFCVYFVTQNELLNKMCMTPYLASR